MWIYNRKCCSKFIFLGILHQFHDLLWDEAAMHKPGKWWKEILKKEKLFKELDFGFKQYRSNTLKRLKLNFDFFVEMKIIKNFTSIKLLGNHQSREKSGKPRAVPLRWVWVSFYHGVVHAKSKSPNILMKINTFVWKLQSCPDSRNVRNFSGSKKMRKI